MVYKPELTDEEDSPNNKIESWWEGVGSLIKFAETAHAVGDKPTYMRTIEALGMKIKAVKGLRNVFLKNLQTIIKWEEEMNTKFKEKYLVTKREFDKQDYNRVMFEVHYDYALKKMQIIQSLLDEKDVISNYLKGDFTGL